MVMVVSLMHGVPVTSSVVREHRGAIVLFDDVRRPTPKDDRDTTLAILFILWQGIDSVLPVDVNISTKGEQHTIGLWEVDLFTSFSIQEGKLSSRTERHTNSDVLILGSLRIESSAIVMERFPIR